MALGKEGRIGSSHVAKAPMGHRKDFCLVLQLANFPGEVPGDGCFQLCWPDDVAATVTLLTAAEQKQPETAGKECLVQ